MKCTANLSSWRVARRGIRPELAIDVHGSLGHIMVASTPPAYQQVTVELRKLIRSGPDDGTLRLPTEAELVERFQFSRQTIRRAFQELEAEGLVLRVPGRGTFAVRPQGVAEGEYVRTVATVDDLIAVSMDTTVKVLRPPHPVDPDVWVPASFRDTPVSSLRVMRLFDGLPLCVSDVMIPSEIADSLAPLLEPSKLEGTETIIGLLDLILPEGITGASEQIHAVRSPDDVADILGIGKGDPVLKIERLYYDNAGQFVEYERSYFRSDRYVYRAELRRRQGGRSRYNERR